MKFLANRKIATRISITTSAITCPEMLLLFSNQAQTPNQLIGQFPNQIERLMIQK
ncbi:MAG: hypothetical protein HFI28_10435 [Lachnospiraceae bacterium]|jgi:hypothetical protein|nr:hypothetical protein [Lachnospiraceae bacterium]